MAATTVTAHASCESINRHFLMIMFMGQFSTVQRNVSVTLQLDIVNRQASLQQATWATKELPGGGLPALPV
jgi:hypothetical protein